MNGTHAPPRRVRFSLRTILLVVVIVALVVAQVTTMWRERLTAAQNEALAAENARLRVETGFLNVEDPNKIIVLQIPSLDENTWRWKVYLPKGNWTLDHQLNDIPKVGLTRTSGSMGLVGPRQVLVAASVRKGASGQWQFVIQSDNSSSRSGLKDDHRLVAGEYRGHSSSSAGIGKQQMFDGDRPVELLRLRTNERIEAGPGSWTRKESLDPVDGILIWIERKK